MRSILSVVLIGALIGTASIARAQSMDKKKGGSTMLSGYVVDAMCAKGMAGKETTMKKAAAHTRGCALEEACASSGFGVFSEGKWYKFDEKGDAMAKELIEKSTTAKGLMVDVSGELKGNIFVLASIKEHPAEMKPDKAGADHKN